MLLQVNYSTSSHFFLQHSILSFSQEKTERCCSQRSCWSPWRRYWCLEELEEWLLTWSHIKDCFILLHNRKICVCILLSSYEGTFHFFKSKFYFSCLCMQVKSKFYFYFHPDAPVRLSKMTASWTSTPSSRFSRLTLSPSTPPGTNNLQGIPPKLRGHHGQARKQEIRAVIEII